MTPHEPPTWPGDRARGGACGVSGDPSQGGATGDPTCDPTSDAPASRALSRALALALHEPLRMAQRPVVSAPAGTLLLHSGEPVHRLPLLISGRIDTVMHLRSAQDPPVLPVSFVAGELVLLSQLFCDRPSIVDLVAGEPVRLCWVPLREIEEVLLRDHAALVLLVRFLGQRLREVQMREKTWIERGAQERVSALLARLAAQQAPQADGARAISATHEELAARCGVSRPKTSLALKRLEQAGLLRLTRGRIDVVDIDALLAGPRSPATPAP